MPDLFSPATIILLASLLISLLYWLNVFFILYHFIRFGIGTRPKQAALIFLIGSIMLFLLAMTTFVFLSMNIPSFARNFSFNLKQL